jgi:hypothetical protein
MGREKLSMDPLADVVQADEGMHVIQWDDDERCTPHPSYRGFWYQKIAKATKATVMIHRTISLARFFSFSSAIGAVQHT